MDERCVRWTRIVFLCITATGTCAGIVAANIRFVIRLDGLQAGAVVGCSGWQCGLEGVLQDLRSLTSLRTQEFKVYSVNTVRPSTPITVSQALGTTSSETLGRPLSLAPQTLAQDLLSAYSGTSQRVSQHSSRVRSR